MLASSLFFNLVIIILSFFPYFFWWCGVVLLFEVITRFCHLSRFSKMLNIGRHVLLFLMITPWLLSVVVSLLFVFL
jgi:hypothetical protein